MGSAQVCDGCSAVYRFRGRHLGRCRAIADLCARATLLDERPLDLDIEGRRHALHLIAQNAAYTAYPLDAVLTVLAQWHEEYWIDVVADYIVEDTSDGTLVISDDDFCLFEPAEDHPAAAAGVIHVAQRLLDLDDHLWDLLVLEDSSTTTSDLTASADLFDTIAEHGRDLDPEACDLFLPILQRLCDQIYARREVLQQTPGASNADLLGLLSSAQLAVSTFTDTALSGDRSGPGADTSDWTTDSEGAWRDAKGDLMMGHDAVLIEQLLASPEQERWAGWGSLPNRDWHLASPSDLGDLRHRHVTATHSRSAYPDPDACETCFDWAQVIVDIHRIRQRRARTYRDAEYRS